MQLAPPIGTWTCPRCKAAEIPRWGDGRVRSTATLVVCPSHLVAQWAGETKKFVKDGHLRIVKITTKIDHNKVTWRDMLTADLVLVSVQFLHGIAICLAQKLRLRFAFTLHETYPIWQKQSNLAEALCFHFVKNLACMVHSINETPTFCARQIAIPCM